MFYKIFKRIPSINRSNKENTINDYFNDIPEPYLDRKNTKYYVEMQLLAFQLMRYLKMDEKSEEYMNQGRYNWTYFAENLKREDMYFLINKLRGNLTSSEWNAIHESRTIVHPERPENEYVFEKSSTGDSYIRIIYKPKGHEEIERVVKKIVLKQALEEIHSRVEIDYLKTELVEYKEESE